MKTLSFMFAVATAAMIVPAHEARTYLAQN